MKYRQVARHKNKLKLNKLLAGMFAIFLTYLFICDLYAAPQSINYQGVLHDDAGNPVNDSVTMLFRIYPSVDSTTELWSSGNVTVQVDDGQFSINLGELPQNPFASDLFNEDSRYLGVTVEGRELVPRKKLVSVPFALNASSGIPTGVIVMWSGAVENIPEGWVICDGQNGTPDLRDRFIVGAGGTYTVGQTGGTNKNIHAHGIVNDSPGTSAAGNHNHSFSVVTDEVKMDDSDPTDKVEDGNNRMATPEHRHWVNGTTSTNGNHSHTVNAHSHGGKTGDTELENRPPYYALCFIMKK